MTTRLRSSGGHADLHGELRRQLAAIGEPANAVGTEVFPHVNLP